MTKSMPIEEASRHLAEIVSTLQPGDEIELTTSDRTVAAIIPKLAPKTAQSGFGALKGRLTIVRENDDYLADFKEYM